VSKKHVVHVSTTPTARWKVTQNAEENFHTHRTQGLADGAARRLAVRDGVERVTHGRDGKIRSKDSFGDDPVPPRDRMH
jgi:hypothetical protein